MEYKIEGKPVEQYWTEKIAKRLVDKTLRGKKWYERHNRAEEYKQEIVNFKYE